MLRDRFKIQSENPETEPHELRMGLVGTGPWAEDIHFPVLSSHPSAAFVGIWDRTNSKAKKLAESAGVRAFESYESMLESVDAVSFAVAPNAQPALAKSAVSHGRHVLLEKPLGFSLPESESLVRVIAEAGVASLVFFTRRFEPKTASALAAIAEERTWDSASACFMSGAMRPGTPYAGCEWRQRYGALWDIGPHAISLVLPVMGGVETVEANRDERKTTRLRLTHINGGKSEILLSVHAEPEEQGESYIFRAGSHAAKLDVSLDTTVRRGAYAKALEFLVSSSKTGLPHACNPNFALSVQKILVAADTSLERGAPQPVGT